MGSELNTDISNSAYVTLLLHHRSLNLLHEQQEVHHIAEKENKCTDLNPSCGGVVLSTRQEGSKVLLSFEFNAFYHADARLILSRS